MLQHNLAADRVQPAYCVKTTKSNFSYVYLQSFRDDWLLHVAAGSIVILCSSVMPARGQAQVVTSPPYATPGTAVDAVSKGSTPNPSNLPTPSNAAGAAIPVSGTGAAAPAFTSPIDPYSNFRWKGVIISLPGPSDTIDGELGGLRQKLAQDYGVGYLGYSINTFYNNTLHAAHSIGGNQVYLGQRPTSISANSIAALIDLSRYGISDGQIVVSGYYESTSWNPAGPNKLGLNALSYYQTFLDKKLEVKVGLIGQTYEFAGTYVGGSLSGGIFGNSGNLFLEAGSNGQTVPTLGIDIKANISQYFYDKIGVGRSLNPDGAVVEVRNNPSGLNLTTRNSGLWAIDEVGYLRPPTTIQTKVWVRGGALLSEARYIERDHPSLRGNNNYGLYFLADKQLLQTSSVPIEAYRGLYAGFSAEYVPPSYNTFSQYYEGRIYGLGLIPNRPKDQISLVANSFTFSKSSVNLARKAGQMAHTGSQAITLSYSAHILPGSFLSLGIGYTNNPSPVTYKSNTGSDLNVIVGLSFFL